MAAPIVPTVRRPTLAALASAFGWYGNSTFGGGTATIVEIERHIIDEHAWLGRRDSHLAYAISRLTPGTNLLAYCVGAGWRMRGLTGGLVALCAASLPSAALAIVLTRFFALWSERPLTAAALRGALAAAIAIMVGTAWTMMRPTMKGRQAIRTVLLAIAAFGFAYFVRVTPVQVLFAAAGLGALWPEEPTA
jgi:chromate transporter